MYRCILCKYIKNKHVTYPITTSLLDTETYLNQTFQTSKGPTEMHAHTLKYKYHFTSIQSHNDFLKALKKFQHFTETLIFLAFTHVGGCVCIRSVFNNFVQTPYTPINHNLSNLKLLRPLNILRV